MPTIFATTAFGLSNTVGRMTTIMSSLVSEIEFPVPLIIMIIVALMAAVVSPFII